MHSQSKDNGSMSVVVGLLVIVIIIALIVFAIFTLPSYFGGKDIGRQLSNVPFSPKIASDVMGYADIPGQVGNVMVHTAAPDPHKLGYITLPITIEQFSTGPEGPPAIDMQETRIWFTANGKGEELPRVTTLPLTRPAWTVAAKGGIPAGYAADQDDLLEPNEVFTLLILPGTALPDGTPFSINVNLADEWPLTVNMTVPSPVTEQMDLGLPRNLAPM